MNELITVRNVETGKIGRCTERDLALLGSKFIVVKGKPQGFKPDENVPKEQPVKQPETDAFEAKAADDMNKEQLLEALKGFGLKGLHLYSMEKLRQTYENKIHQNGEDF